ncbi:MAG: hypothetical protein ABIX10_00965 [Acidimicrobiales bacterium]
MNDKKRVSLNAVRHGGYSDRHIIHAGVFAEDAGEYERGLAAFLGAVRPLNAAAEQCAVRVFNELRKLDRVDQFEARGIEHAGKMPDVDPDLDLKVELATIRVNRAADDLIMWEDLLDHYEADTLDPVDRDILLALARAHTDGDLDETVAGVDGPDVDASRLAESQAAIMTSLTFQFGSVSAAIEQRIRVTRRQLRSVEAELEAIHVPLSEEDSAAMAGAALVEGGFFERLSRPRSTIAKTLRQAWEQFASFQDLGPPPTDS